MNDQLKDIYKSFLIKPVKVFSASVGNTNLSYKTAISRKTISSPLKKLLSKNKIIGRTIDYGCGKGKDFAHLKESNYDVQGYDPYWRNTSIHGKFDTVLCTYVLNVVSSDERNNIINILKNLTNPGGKIYITVRRDIKTEGKTSIGTYQYNVKLPFDIMFENSSYCIYEIST
jgi:2-polyprenyl-3-methyl-5-hydroxy-6-metoxy-1,4-benzoquinol methylase